MAPRHFFECHISERQTRQLSGARAASEHRDCVKKSSFQSQPDSIRSDDESEYTYEEDDEEEEDLKDQSEKLEPDSSYEAQAEKILEDPNVSKEVSPDLVKNWPLLVF